MKILKDSNGDWLMGIQLIKDCELKSPLTGELIQLKTGDWILRTWRGQAIFMSEKERTYRQWEIINNS